MENRRAQIIETLRRYVTAELLELLLEDSSSEDRSSSSSDESIDSDNDMFLEEQYLKAEAVEAAVLERGDPLPKVGNFLIDVVMNYTDEQFRKNFRVMKAVANKLVVDFASCRYCPQEDGHGGVQKISPEAHILSFLWYAGNKDSMREVANLFGMSLSTFFRCSERVMLFLVELGPSVIKFPNTPEGKQAAAAKFFEKKGFPNVLGAIDGSYINIRTPAHKIRSTYVNRHDGISITLQGICDGNLMFVDAFTGCSSRMHDSRIFKESFISNDLPEICENGLFHIIGDSAYPIRPYLLTPYREAENLSQEKRRYNLKLCGTRVTIENVFGILKKRFRQLLMLEFWTVDKITLFIISCCVLHNLCIIADDVEDFFDVPEEEWAEVHREGEGYDEPEEVRNARARRLKRLGEQKREYLATQL